MEDLFKTWYEGSLTPRSIVTRSQNETRKNTLKVIEEITPRITNQQKQKLRPHLSKYYEYFSRMHNLSRRDIHNTRSQKVLLDYLEQYATLTTQERDRYMRTQDGPKQLFLVTASIHQLRTNVNSSRFNNMEAFMINDMHKYMNKNIAMLPTLYNNTEEMIDVIDNDVDDPIVEQDEQAHDLSLLDLYIQGFSAPFTVHHQNINQLTEELESIDDLKQAAGINLIESQLHMTLKIQFNESNILLRTHGVIPSKTYTIVTFDDILQSLYNFISKDNTAGSDAANVIFNTIPGQVNSVNGINITIKFSAGQPFGNNDKFKTNKVCISISQYQHIFMYGGEYTLKTSDKNCSIHALDRLFRGQIRKYYKLPKANRHISKLRREFNLSDGGIGYHDFMNIYKYFKNIFDNDRQYILSDTERDELKLVDPEWEIVFSRPYNKYSNILTLGGHIHSSSLAPVLLSEYRSNNLDILIFYNSHMFYVYDFECYYSDLNGNIPANYRTSRYFAASHNISFIEIFWNKTLDELKMQLRLHSNEKNNTPIVPAHLDYEKNLVPSKRGITVVKLSDDKVIHHDYADLDNIMKTISLTSSDRIKLSYEDKVSKRGLLFFDIETFMDRDNIQKGKCLIRDTILYAQYIEPSDLSIIDGMVLDKKNNESEDQLTDRIISTLHSKSKKLSFTTYTSSDGQYISSTRQFLDWIASNPYSFYVYSHNGANFDHYFILNSLNLNEMKYAIDKKILRMGTSYIRFEIPKAEFRDTAKFMLGSLSSIAKSFFPSKPELWKTEDARFFDTIDKVKRDVDSKELCFYKSSRKMISENAISFKDFISKLPNESIDDIPDDIESNYKYTFWKRYCDYCEQDVYTLMVAWVFYRRCCIQMDKKMISSEAGYDVFGNEDTFTEEKKIYKKMPGKMHIDNCMTIGNHVMTRLKCLKTLCPRFRQFTDANSNCYDIFNLINRAKIGGISVSNMRGFFDNKIIAYDVKSLYPAALIHGWFVGGIPKYHNLYESLDIDSFKSKVDAGVPMMLTVRNLKFLDTSSKQRSRRVYRPSKNNMFGMMKSDASIDYIDVTYRPVLEQDELQLNKLRMMLTLNESERTWLSETTTIVQTTCSSLMLKYLITIYGLYDYEVIEVVEWEKWLRGTEIFNSIIGVAYNMKQNEDDLKDSRNEKYNPVLREACKLTMNSLTGKLGQSKHGRENLYLTDDMVEVDESEVKDLLAPCTYITDDNKRYKTSFVPRSTPDNMLSSEFTIHMILLYEQSKMMLMNYLLCLYDIGGDFYAIETDSIHLDRKYQVEYEKYINENTKYKQCYFKVNPDNFIPKLDDDKLKLFTFMKAGDDVKDLGELAVDKLGDSAYYIGKKKYAIINNNGKSTYRLAGFRAATTRFDGSTLDLISENVYKRILQNSDKFVRSISKHLMNTFISNSFILDQKNNIYMENKHKYKTSQFVGHLHKNADQLLILQSKATKSVSPIFSTSINNPYVFYNNDDVCDIPGDVLEEDNYTSNINEQIIFDGSR